MRCLMLLLLVLCRRWVTDLDRTVHLNLCFEKGVSVLGCLGIYPSLSLAQESIWIGKKGIDYLLIGIYKSWGCGMAILQIRIVLLLLK